MMGPLSIKAQVQQDAGRIKNQMQVVKTLGDEARKKDLHKIKLSQAEELHRLKIAKEIAKYKAEGIDVDEKKLGLESGVPKIPHPMGKPTNPESGPTDTIPAMLAPGEAVIPAKVAQDPQYKPVIEQMVGEGRKRNRVQGFEDGSLMVGSPEFDKLINTPVEQLTPEQREMIRRATQGIEKLAAADTLGRAASYNPTANKTERAMADSVSNLINKGPMAMTASDRAELQKEIDRAKDPVIRQQLLAEYNKGTDVPKPPAPIEAGANALLATRLTQARADLEKAKASGNRQAFMQAQDRLDTLERQQSMTTAGPPLIPKQTQGAPLPQSTNGKVAGAPPTPAVPPPASTVPAPVPKQKTDPVFSKNDLDPSEIRRTDQYQSQIDSVLKDQKVQEDLVILEKSTPPPGVDPKSWLADGLSKIFGPTGMFNSEDLIRFSLLAAGGLLTGGSTGGSLRFAGLATLRASDERRAGQAAAAARQQAAQQAAQLEMSKNDRERVEAVRKDYHESFKKASPEARKAAEEMYSKAEALRLAGRTREADLLMSQGLKTLNMNQVDTTADNSDKFNQVQDGYDPKTGKPVKFYTNKKNEFFLVDADGNHTPLKGTGKQVMGRDQYRDIEKQQRSKAESMIKERLIDSNRRKDGSVIDKNKTGDYFSAKASGMADTLMSLRDYFGHDIDPNKFGKIVSNTVANLGEELSDPKVKDVSPEALTRIVLGSAVMSARPSSAKYYKANTESGRPSMQANLMYSDVVEKAKASGMDVAEFVTDMEATYEKLDPKVKKKYEDSTKTGDNIGYSPYLLWVRDTINK